jgi:hypothetical protein
MRRLVGESRLPRLGLDISDNDVPRAVEKIADWMECTGGLWIEEGGATGDKGAGRGEKVDPLNPPLEGN